MFYGGYAYQPNKEKAYEEERLKAKEKLAGLKWEKVSSFSTNSQYHFTIQFADETADVTEADVIYGIADMPFGGSCRKGDHGIFEITEYTD